MKFLASQLFACLSSKESLQLESKLRQLYKVTSLKSIVSAFSRLANVSIRTKQIYLKLRFF